MNKKIIVVLTVLILLLILVSIPSYAQNDIKEKQKNKKYEILFKFKEESKVFSTQSLNIKGVKEIPKIGVKKIKVDTEEEYLSILEELKNDPNVEYAQPNTKYHKMQIPNDTYISEDWGIECINAPGSWDLTVGSEEIIIAVVDTGVDYDNPEFTNKLVKGYDFVNSDESPQDDDFGGHGTLVSQVIGANANNGFSKAGVSWNSKIMPLKVLDYNGDGYTYDIANAITYAADNDAKIINLSLGAPESGHDQTLYNAIQYAYNKGVLIVAASGNAYDDTKYSVYYPAAYEEVIAVGAIDKNETIADFSCRGTQLTMVAPGEKIIGYHNNQKVLSYGTSFSAPYVSGAASLVWSIYPELTNVQVRAILENTARDIGDTGIDDIYGYGVLDVHEAVKESIELLYNQENYLYGDFNDNNIIDIYDLVKISRKINTSYEDKKYLDIYDINNDRIIDLLDLNIQTLKYGNRFLKE